MAAAMKSPWLVSLSRYTHAAPAAAEIHTRSEIVSRSLSRSCGAQWLGSRERWSFLCLEFNGFHSVAQIKETSRAINWAARAGVTPDEGSEGVRMKGDNVRVRFAPSPTGNLHVGGARTALFNYLFAKSRGGEFILRIEDTDLERSTRESEEAVIRDLQWLGLEWDEGPDKSGKYGPYRQSERTQIYKMYADKLLESGQVYRCFCSDEELEAMREDAKSKNLPPRYVGKWATASKPDIEAELVKGTPFTYRFRVPQEGSVVINDLIRGEVSWSKDTLGDFVILRSNGQPVYNFCVAVDDATMHITHVIRAEEHLPNTLRQVLIYSALGFSMPKFGHCSLILAPDRSKLSKRHGATSVGQFKELGYLPQAMVNYLALLGWNDGSEEEIFTIDKIIEKFTIERITKSSAIFDLAKLGWMNGQHLRALPLDEVSNILSDHWLKAGVFSQSDGAIVMRSVELVRNSIDTIADSEGALLDIFSYPLHATLASDQGNELVNDNLAEVAASVIAAHDSGELPAAIDGGHDTWITLVKSIGKPLKRKGKRLFMPIRVLLTGRMQGPDLGDGIAFLKAAESSGIVRAPLVTLAERIQLLKQVDWSLLSQRSSASTSQEPTPLLLH